MRMPVSPAAFKSFICARISSAASFRGGGSFTRPRAVSTSSTFNSPSASWPISRPGGAAHRVVRSDRDEAIPADRNAFRDRERRIDGDDFAVMENQVRGLRLNEGAPPGGEDGDGENCGDSLHKNHVSSVACRDLHQEPIIGVGYPGAKIRISRPQPRTTLEE